MDFSQLKPNLRTCRFTVPPAVALLNYISSGILWWIFCQTGIFAGFSLFISLISQDTPPYCDFSRFFFQLLFAVKISEDAMCTVQGGGQGILYFIVSVIDRLQYTQSTRVYALPPPLKVSVTPPLDPKGGRNTLFQVRGLGTQFGRLDRRPGTLYTLWPRWQS